MSSFNGVVVNLEVTFILNSTGLQTEVPDRCKFEHTVCKSDERSTRSFQALDLKISKCMYGNINDLKF